MASNMHLFWGSGSVPCWKPMLVLHEKGLKDYKETIVSFEKKEHKGDNIMKLNPRGQVPTFTDEGVVVNESGAICDYLEYKYCNKGTRLLPENAAERAKVLQRVYESQNLARTLLEGVVYYYFRTKKEDWNEAVLETKKSDAKEELKRWEEYLGQGNDFVVGSSFTMADVYVFPVLAFAIRSQLNMGSYPNLKKYYDKVKARDSVKATWPPHWANSEGKDMMSGV